MCVCVCVCACVRACVNVAVKRFKKRTPHIMVSSQSILDNKSSFAFI